MEPSLLNAAYLSAIYGADIDGERFEFTFSRTRFAPSSPILLTTPQPWALISAANPMSRPLPAHENHARHTQFLAALNHAGLSSAAAWGRSADYTWHEDSRLIWGCSQETAFQLADTFNQRACIWSNAVQTGLLHRPSGVWTVRSTVQLSI